MLPIAETDDGATARLSMNARHRRTRDRVVTAEMRAVRRRRGWTVVGSETRPSICNSACACGILTAGRCTIVRCLDDCEAGQIMCSVVLRKISNGGTREINRNEIGNIFNICKGQDSPLKSMAKVTSECLCAFTRAHRTLLTERPDPILDFSWRDLSEYFRCIVVARAISAGRAKRWWPCCGGGGSHSRLARAATRAIRPAGYTRSPRTVSHTGKQTVIPLHHTTYLGLPQRPLYPSPKRLQF
ncbi:unnamed protein product [Chrysodeixis includens]|uniref:Uncharacterized protein n=1 Tax=Chrysodeixis includens TaxID=689277 RepID=A0A9N8KZS2_CHRIL|nr:unnamed protein product [Chrysodeixis includens]